MKPYLLWSILIVLFIIGCSKSKSPGPVDNGSSNPKLSIVSGNNQTAKVGFFPSDTIKVKLTGNGINTNNYSVEFRGSGCNADLPVTSGFENNGTTIAYYRLAGNTGAQTFQATLIEQASGKRIDSVIFNFTGTPLTTGLNYSACTPSYTSNTTFCKTGSGRLFAAFGASSKNAMRYSDDEGASWYPVKALGANHRFQAVRSDGKNQVMADGFDEGIYYSADNGDTWVLRSNVPFKGKQYGSMTYTSTGKMLYAVKYASLYYSEDNGLTWSTLTLPADNYWTPQEGPGGEFYIFGEALGLYKSTDKGQHWNLLPGVVKAGGPHDGMFAFYVDDKTGYVYKSAQQPTQLFWISKDGGDTYQTYLSSISTLANYIYKFNDVLYFQSVGGIYKIDAPNHAVKLFSDIQPSFDGNFMVSDHNNLIFPTTNFIYVLK
ncbi:sialidase family protein [Mucilaginibacter flavidus]|uniref:sialidase family protein n=1 Tax=Mucilaginibacter flavidus TaxID=2949309 RepID=UPI002092D2B8|nr:sialidase family protein [Mucilaginibacter flavidus]MCO5947756.1 glycoside hydrolase [Mucilaginibacter flavidus]